MPDHVRRVHYINDEQSASSGAAERLRHAQIISTKNPGIQRADAQPADSVDLLGRRKYSKEARAQIRRMEAIQGEGEASSYTFLVGTAVAYTTVATGMVFARGVQDRLDEEAPGSLAASFGELIAVDQFGQVRGLAADVMDQYKSRTLRG